MYIHVYLIIFTQIIYYHIVYVKNMSINDYENQIRSCVLTAP